MVNRTRYGRLVQVLNSHRTENFSLAKLHRLYWIKQHVGWYFMAWHFPIVMLGISSIFLFNFFLHVFCSSSKSSAISGDTLFYWCSAFDWSCQRRSLMLKCLCNERNMLSSNIINFISLCHINQMAGDLGIGLFFALCLSLIHLTNGSGKPVSTCHIHPFPPLESRYIRYHENLESFRNKESCVQPDLGSWLHNRQHCHQL